MIGRDRAWGNVVVGGGGWWWVVVAAKGSTGHCDKRVVGVMSSGR